MASRFSELRELEKEEKRKAKEEMRLSKKDTERLLGKDWRRRPQGLIARQQKTLSEQRAQRKVEVEKVKEDMRSGKTSRYVGKAYREGRDPYAGVQGPLPMYRTPEEAEAAGQTRYISPEQEQYMPAPAYVGKSPEEAEEMSRSGEYPVVGRFKPTEGKGVEVRRAIPVQRAFKAMVEGDPASDRVFATSSEAQAYIKRMGGRGAISSVRGTPEEIAKYQEQAVSGAKREGELADLYNKRTSESKARSEKLQAAMQDYDEAESPELKATAKARIDEAKREIDVAQKTRGMKPEQKKKFEAGLADIVQRRGQREAARAKETEIARGESRAFRADIEATKAAENILKYWNRQVNGLKRAYRAALVSGDDIEAIKIDRMIKRYESIMPEDENERMNAAREGVLRERISMIEEEENKRRESLRRSNPDAS